MLPSEMNLNIRSGTAGYNNEILISKGMFSLGMPKAAHTSASMHKEERVALVLVLTVPSEYGMLVINERYETR